MKNAYETPPLFADHLPDAGRMAASKRPEPFVYSTMREAMGAPDPRAPHNSTTTSQEAAHAIAPHMQAEEARVLAYLRGVPDGSTREQIASGTGMKESAVCARVNAMVARGVLNENGDTRPTSSGRPAKVVKVGQR